MKKLLSLLFAILIILSCPVFAGASGNLFTSADALNILRYAAGLSELIDEQYELYDLNFDGIINTQDALIILNIISGLVEQPEPPAPPVAAVVLTLTEAVSYEGVSVTITGLNVGTCSVRIGNFTEEPITVTIPPGTVFTSRNLNTADMIVTAEYTFWIKEGSTVNSNVFSASMNIWRDIPNSNTGFTVSQLPENDRLTKLMQVFGENNNHFLVQQAAVWMMTNSNERDDSILNRLGIDGVPVMTLDQLREARDLIAIADRR
jgi:hypothetical protein